MTFQFEKLTAKAQEAIAAAQSRASENGNPEFGTVLKVLSAVGVTLTPKMHVS